VTRRDIAALRREVREARKEAYADRANLPRYAKLRRRLQSAQKKNGLPVLVAGERP
jgi:hypothetical protein